MQKQLALFLLLVFCLFTSCTKKLGHPAQREKDSFVFADGASFKHPPSWSVHENNGFVTASGPEPGLSIHIMPSARTKNASVDAVAMWQKIKSDFAYPIYLAQTPPAERGFEQVDSVIFNVPSAESRTVMAIGLSYHEQTYWLLVEANNDLLSRRGAEVMIILESFRIAGMSHEVKLSSTPKPWGDEEKQAFHNFLVKALQELSVPGAAVLIVDSNGHRVFHDALGVKDINKKDPITLDTPFLIGSTTKSLTTLMMAKLVDEHVITWETKIKDVLKNFSINDEILTDVLDMRNSVSASTGMPRRDYEFIFTYQGISAEQRLDELRFMAPTTKMGETFQYSNHLVMAGGYAAATAYAKKSNLAENYSHAMSELVFKPLGMKRTFLSFDRAKKLGSAYPHAVSIDGKLKRMPLDYEHALIAMAPAGALWSTVEDLSRYMVMELNKGVLDGKRVINEGPLLERRKPGAVMGESHRYGLGLFMEDFMGLNLVGHDGNTLGFSTLMIFIPEAGLGLVMMTNGSGTNAFLQAAKRKFLELTFDAPKTVDDRLIYSVKSQKDWRAELKSHLQTDTKSMAWISAWQGTYKNETLGDISIKKNRSGKWILDAGEWSSDVATMVDSNGKHNIFLTTPPFLFTFQPHEETKSLFLDADEVKYNFVRDSREKK